jgi:hypothetical protein
MKTPAGTECAHYYEDYNRGQSVQECRLIKANPESLPWKPQDCVRCPIPGILRANASPDMELTLTVQSRLLGLQRRLEVTATCLTHHVVIDDPHIGCRLDHHPGLDLFQDALSKLD